MDYGLESSSSSSSIEQTPEVSEEISDSGYESAEISEDFDDCSTEEVSEVNDSEIESAESVDEIPENYDDCEIDEVSASSEIDESKVEEYEDFDDCAVESSEVSEEELETEPEVSEEEIENDAEISEEDLEAEPEVSEEEIEGNAEISEEELEAEPEVSEEQIESDAEISEEDLEAEPEVSEEEIENDVEVSEEELETEPEVSEEEIESDAEITEEELGEEPEVSEEEIENDVEVSEEELETEPEVSEEEIEDNAEISEEELEAEPEVSEEEIENDVEVSEEELEAEPEVSEEEIENDVEVSEEELEAEPEISEEDIENDATITEEELEAESEVSEEEIENDAEISEEELEVEPEIFEEEIESNAEISEEELEAESEVSEEDIVNDAEISEEKLEAEPEVSEEEIENDVEVSDEELEENAAEVEEQTAEKQEEVEEENAEIKQELEENEEELEEQNVETQNEIEEENTEIEQELEENEEELEEQNAETQNDIEEENTEIEQELEENTEEAEEQIAENQEEIEEQNAEIQEEIEENTEIEQELEENTEEAEGQIAENQEEIEEQNAEIQEEIEEEDAETEQELEGNVEEIENQTAETQGEIEEENAEFKNELKKESEISEEMEKEIDNYEETKSEFQRAKEIRDENAERIDDLVAKKSELEKESSEKFDAVTKEERGTEEYKSALKALNDTKDQQADIESQLKDAQKKQEDFERKTIELREAQIEKGNEAVELSSISIDKANNLQDRFDSQIYGDRLDAKELINLQNDNSRLISEMSAERDSVHLAMDAKMSEIRDYVYANNLERFDTERDPYYQKLISEYRSLDEAYHRLDYNVVKLDENNIQISEITGKEYESVRFMTGSQIEEVRQGTDRPGETNYFVDELKARETLSSFRQSQWENLSVKEQKSAIENLASYNASILGIDNPPAIVYYRSDDVTDFGGFSESQHTIYINESNMRDAAETADTISHEFRHCYQHERAERLENERDLEFREGFENYVSPENDYARYRDQLVEQDARDYADEVRKEIAKLENNQIQDALYASVREGDAKSFETLNPEKGTVFEETTTDQLPEDFAKKIVETKEYKEIFETAELQEIKEHVTPAYENGAEIANRIEEFNTYKEHHEIDGGHIGKVHDKSLQAADVLEEAFGNDSYNGLYSSNIDRKSLEMMALYHDTGMDGNVSADKFDEAKQAYLDTPGRREEYVQKLLNKKPPELSVEEANRKYENEAFESQFRKEHSVQSAIHALRDREFIENHGADADRVALGCLAHSKSNSGVGNLADENQWNDAIGRLNNAVAEFNRTHPNEKIEFNDSFLRNEKGEFNNESLAEMRSEALCLRIGDANGHDSKSHTSQNGKEISFSLDDWKNVKDDLPQDLRNKIESGDCNNFFAEVQNANVEIDGVHLDNSNDKTGFSRMFAVGEGNFKNVDLEMVDGIPTQKFELENGDAYPMSTQYCILERLKEYNTAKIDPQMEIEHAPGMSDKDYEKYVQAQLDSMSKVDFVAEINIGASDDMTTYTSYKAFADKVHTDYGINVRIVPEKEINDSSDRKSMKNDAAKSFENRLKDNRSDNRSLKQQNIDAHNAQGKIGNNDGNSPDIGERERERTR